MYPLLSPQWRAAGRPTITPYHAHSESPATMTTSLNNSRSGDSLLEINKMDVYSISTFPISPPHTSSVYMKYEINQFRQSFDGIIFEKMVEMLGWHV